MKFSALVFITKRLTLSRRNKGIVHIISLISLAGIAVGAFALVVVLSVFNGFTDVAKTMLEKSCPPLLVENAQGSTLNMDDYNDSMKIHYPVSVIPVIKQTAMISVGDNRSIVTIMGIDSSYFKYNALDSFIVSGKNVFDIKDSLFCLMGINEASLLGLHRGAEKMGIPVKFTVPATDGEDAMVIEDKFSTINVFYQAAYQTHSDLDEGIVFISLNKARELLGIAANECSNLYIVPKNTVNTDKIKTELEKQTNNKYNVKTILEQEPVYFRIVRSEKLAVYIILSFIIFIATINIISTIIILHIQKEKMNKILRTMGMQLKDLRKIYFAYGITINIFGCLLGILLGLVMCVLQQYFGLVKLAQDAFVVDAFPVKIMFKDIISVFVLVILIGTVSIRAVTAGIKEKI